MDLVGDVVNSHVILKMLSGAEEYLRGTKCGAVVFAA
jgi:hypothetical protein